MEKLRVLQINIVCNIGSTGRIAEGIGQQVIQNGWESYIAYGRYGRTSTSQTIKIGSRYSFVKHVLIARIFDKQGLGSRRATIRFIEKIKIIKPDIIHLHNIHGYYLNHKLLFNYLKTIDIPIVWTLHDCWCMTGHCSHFLDIKCNKWKEHCSDCPHKSTYPRSIFSDRSRKNYLEKKELFSSLSNLTIVAVSDWIKDIVRQSFLKEQTVRRIYNGVDLNVFRVKEPRKKGLKTKILGVASSWSDKKGLGDFMVLRSLLSPETYDITLVGLTQKQIQHLPLGIHGVKKTENIQELVKFYQEADVFVNPTWADSFPTTNIESLACGTPVITYKTGGSVEAITPETGEIVDIGDHCSLVSAIDHILSMDPINLTQNCRKRSEMFYNKEDRFKEYIDLYEELVSERNN